MRKQPVDPTNKKLVQLGISPGQACDILKRRKLPSLKLAVEIEDRLGIPARWWIDRKETA